MLDFPESSEHKETMPLLSKCRSKNGSQAAGSGGCGCKQPACKHRPRMNFALAGGRPGRDYGSSGRNRDSNPSGNDRRNVAAKACLRLWPSCRG